MVNIETVGYTNKLCARLAEGKHDAFYHTLVYVTAVITLADKLTV